MTLLRRAWGVITWVTIGVVAFVALLTALLPMALGLTTYTVLTGSMTPALGPGALIGVKSVGIDEVAPGDIVTYQIRSCDPTIATHRVVGLVSGTNGRLLITKGDANDTADPAPVQEEQLVGIVRYAVPYFGYVNAWGSPAVKAVGTTVVGAGFILWGVVQLVRSNRETRGRRSARRTQTSLTLAVAAIGVTGGLMLMMGSVPVEALAHETRESLEAEENAPKLLVSLDETTWSASVPLEFPSGPSTWVPGDSATAIVHVQNASDVVADLALRVGWAALPVAGAELDLGQADSFRVTARSVDVAGHDFTKFGTLQAGETIALPIIVTFAPNVVGRTLTEELIEFSAELRLTEATSVEYAGGAHTSQQEFMLGTTGVSHHVWLAAGLVLVLVGLALIMTRRVLASLRVRTRAHHRLSS